MVLHAYLSSNVSLFDGRFVQIVVVKESAKSQILHQRKVVGVTFVVTNMELIKVHNNLQSEV
jgi:hypothetical protein